MVAEVTPGVAPIGVVVAMESELQHLLALTTAEREVQHGPWRDRFVTVGKVPVVALCCGIGMVNAAAGTEHLIGRHAPRAIFNFGCVGAHRRDILPGDVVIGDGAVNHGAVHILASGDEYFPGQEYQFAGEVVALTELATDPTLRELTIAAAEGRTPGRGDSTCRRRSSSARRWSTSGGSARRTSGTSSTSGSTGCTGGTAPSARTWRRQRSPRSVPGTECPS
jgi:nucleoside phosphorylase